jgi:bacteriorhodopsin
MMAISFLSDLTLLGTISPTSVLPNEAQAAQALTSGQFNLVYNATSFSIAAMFAAALFFFNAQAQVGTKYRLALLISAIVVSIAGYHYFRIFNSWNEAYSLKGGMYLATGTPFNDAYRYVDWLLTVPLLLVEAVAVLALPKQQTNSLLTKLVIAAILMIVTGYPGEISDVVKTRLIWGAISTVPFAYILYILWVELSDSLGRQTPDVQAMVRNLRLLLLFSWGVYPIVYLLPVFGISSTSATVAVQVGYTIADVLAKPLFGLIIFGIAVSKTQTDLANSNKLDGANNAPALDLVPSPVES